MRKSAALLVWLLIAAPLMLAQNTGSDVPWWNDRVFYQVFVRSFYDSDGDGVGDLRGVIEKLDYLNDGDPTTSSDLGVTGLWLMPVTQSPSYHGYDVVDYRQIEDDYGTMEDFNQLVQAARARGVAVIIDLVINHTSRQHPWFREAAANPESPYADYYIFSDTLPPGNFGKVVWHPLPDGRYYYGYFDSSMPDLNYANPAVTAEMEAVVRFWLEQVGIDGFRIDAVKHLFEDGETLENVPATFRWMESFQHFVDSVKPDALTVGEIWSGSRVSASYVPDRVDLAFDFELATTLVDGARRRSSSAISAIQEQILQLYPPGQYAAFLTNHDQNRVMSELGGDLGAAKVAATLLLTNPGVPFIYYGEELGMLGKKPDERIRTPMQWTSDPLYAGFSTTAPWEPLDASFASANVQAETDNPLSLLSHYRDLIHLRSAHAALRRGAFTIVKSSERPIYSFLRHTADERLLVVINMNHREIDSYQLGLAEGPLYGVTTAEALLGTGDVAVPTVNAGGGFDAYVPQRVLPPRSTLVIRLS